MNDSQVPPFGEMLRRFRRRRKLSQQKLAIQIERSRESVSLWERGLEYPDTIGIMGTLADALSLNREEKRLFFEARYGVPAVLPLHNLPERNLYFTGREAVLENLDKHVTGEDGKAIAIRQAINGLGGIGKTQVALEYAYRYRREYHDILWAVADSPEALIASYVQLATLLWLPERDEPDQKKVVEAVKRWLSQHRRWLLILDNVEDLHVLRRFVPVPQQGTVILTTRNEVTEPLAQSLILDIMPDEEALLFLLKRAGYLSPEATRTDALDTDVVITAQNVVESLGGLPLALDQAGAYMWEVKCSLQGYMLRYQQQQALLLHRRGSIPTDHPESVMTTFSLAFEQVRQRSPAAAELLKLCTFLAPEAIPEELITGGATHLGVIFQELASDQFAFDLAIESLLTFSLLKRERGSKVLTVHRLVQAVLYHAMTPTEREEWMGRLIIALDTVFPTVTQEVWSACERLVPHVLAVFQSDLTQENSESLEFASLLYKAGIYLRQRSQHALAEQFYLRALHIREQVLGPHHLTVAKSLNGLANLYRDQDNLAQAELFYQRALQISEQQLEPTHSDLAALAAILNNLALVYTDRGKYEQAKLLYERAFHIMEHIHGSLHPVTGHLLNNLALNALGQYQYEEAEQYFLQAREIWEQTLGPDHLDLALTLNGLGSIDIWRGRYEQAEATLQRAVTIIEQSAGPEYYALAHPLSNRAKIYHHRGNDEQAEALLLRGLDILKQSVGPESIQMTGLLDQLAQLYVLQGKYQQAEETYRQAHAIWQQRDEQPTAFAESLADFARFCEEQERFDEAFVSYQQSLALQERLLGADHPHTVDTRTGYVSLVQTQGQSEEAIKGTGVRNEQAETGEQQAQ